MLTQHYSQHPRSRNNPNGHQVMDKENVVCPRITGYYPALKRKEVLIHTVTWIDLENTMLSERNPMQNVSLGGDEMFWRVAKAAQFWLS